MNLGDNGTTQPFASFYRLPVPVTTGDPNGHWLHLLSPITFHATGGQPSNFYALPANTLTIGIEHVPFPPAAMLAFPGLAMVWHAHRKRRRRLVS